MTCPSSDTLIRFADATLADHEAAEVVAHLAVCEVCSRKVDELEHRPDQPMLAAFRELQNVPPVIDADPPLPRKIAQYEILEKIGQGGMGAVYRAMHPHLKREVALKVIRNSRLDDPTARERFVQEMQSLGRLSHPNIVHATDAGIDGDIPFIVTELLNGQDLGSYIEQHGKMSVKQTVDCIRQAATGLAYAHKAGYVHRDIKPSNLFLLRDGTMKILDLGIARPLANSAGTSQTVTGHVIGSPDFMAPEQFRGGTADARSDIYSLGQTFLYMLTGKHDDVSGVPSRLKKVLARMTAGAPSQRFQTADELLKAINALTAIERFKKSMVVLGAAILMIAVLVALRGSSGSDGNMIEPQPVSEARILENVKAELKRDAEHERNKGLQASPEEMESLREELESYKKDKLRYDEEVKEYAEEMKEWEKDKTGYKPPKPIPAFPPIMPPLRFPPEIMKEYKDVIKEWRNDETNENKSSSPATKLESTQDKNVVFPSHFDITNPVKRRILPEEPLRKQKNRPSDDSKSSSSERPGWTSLSPTLDDLCDQCGGRGFDEIICGYCPGYKFSQYCGHKVWRCNACNGTGFCKAK